MNVSQCRIIFSLAVVLSHTATAMTLKSNTKTNPELPEAKKQKISDTDTDTDNNDNKNDTMATTKNVSVPEAPDSEWPEAWYMMEDGTYEDQKERNRLTPNKPASIQILKDLGIAYWKMDAETYSYPAKAIRGTRRTRRTLS